MTTPEIIQQLVRREIESTDRGIDGLVYELPPFGDDIWVEQGRD